MYSSTRLTLYGNGVVLLAPRVTDHGHAGVASQGGPSAAHVSENGDQREVEGDGDGRADEAMVPPVRVRSVSLYHTLWL